MIYVNVIFVIIYLLKNMRKNKKNSLWKIVNKVEESKLSKGERSSRKPLKKHTRSSNSKINNFILHTPKFSFKSTQANETSSNVNSDSQKDSNSIIKETFKDRRAKKITIFLDKELSPSFNTLIESSKPSIQNPSSNKFKRNSDTNLTDRKEVLRNLNEKDTPASGRNTSKIIQSAFTDRTLKYSYKPLIPSYPVSFKRNFKTNDQSSPHKRNLQNDDISSYAKSKILSSMSSSNNKQPLGISMCMTDRRETTKQSIDYIQEIKSYRNTGVPYQEVDNITNIVNNRKRDNSSCNSFKLPTDDKSDRRIITYGLLLDFISTNLREINQIVENQQLNTANIVEEKSQNKTKINEDLNMSKILEITNSVKESPSEKEQNFMRNFMYNEKSVNIFVNKIGNLVDYKNFHYKSLFFKGFKEILVADENFYNSNMTLVFSSYNSPIRNKKIFMKDMQKLGVSPSFKDKFINDISDMEKTIRHTPILKVNKQYLNLDREIKSARVKGNYNIDNTSKCILV